MQYAAQKHAILLCQYLSLLRQHNTRMCIHLSMPTYRSPQGKESRTHEHCGKVGLFIGIRNGVLRNGLVVHSVVIVCRCVDFYDFVHGANFVPIPEPHGWC